MANAKFYLSLRVSPLYKKQASRQCLFESLVPLKRLQSTAVIFKELAALSVINTNLTVAGVAVTLATSAANEGPPLPSVASPGASSGSPCWVSVKVQLPHRLQGTFLKALWEEFQRIRKRG